MKSLWLYDLVSRARWLNYRGKIMLMAFIGTHIPLLAIIGYFVHQSAYDWRAAATIIAVALGATLAGTALTLFVLDQLLRPIINTSRGLRTYRVERRLPPLPMQYTDEAGTLMADASLTLQDLDQAIDDLVNYDKITGLPNRDLLLAEVAKRVKVGQSFALCVLRATNYERIAATFEQSIATTMLRRLTRELKGAVGSAAFISRLEAGVFAFILDDVDGGEAPAAAERIIGALRRETTIEGITILPEVAAGAALFPGDALDAEALLDAAIAALAQSIVGRSARVRFFSTEAREAARRRFLTEQDLRRAIEGREFILHFQPVVDVSAGRAVGAEALIRWRHPERGLVPPGDFIPLAERSGLIKPIGQWTLEAACAQLKAWSLAGLGDLKVAVNVSARQFLDPDLLKVIHCALKDSGVSPNRLEIELTETVAAHSRKHTSELLSALRELGVTVAIDDFGTGYSSISYLKDLPFDKMKIDREFVRGVHATAKSQAICRALIELARGLGIAVQAEGTETEGEVRFLHQEGCKLFQGFYFAEALPAEAFAGAITDLRFTAAAMAAVLPAREAARLKAGIA